MARMYVVREVREWLAEWLAHPSAHAALSRVKHAAQEQRRNYERCAVDDRCPDGVKPASYRKAVELIERAVPKLEKRAAAVDRARAQQEAARQQAAEAESARIREKYNIRGGSARRR